MTRQIELRPDIATLTDSSELRRWYWKKTELATEARRLGLKCTGAKFAILERICHFLDTGEHQAPDDVHLKVTSSFDWHSGKLTPDTIITDNYKNTQNVRRFFRAHLDPGFKFNISFMDWLKQNIGSTLDDAGRYWLSQQTRTTQTKIKPHNQFNQYVRDFLDDNPTLTMKDAREVWARKKATPSDTGRHIYESDDLKLSGE